MTDLKLYSLLVEINFNDNNKLSYIDESVFIYNTNLERITVKNTAIKDFKASLVTDLTVLWCESDEQVVFDMDVFVENSIFHFTTDISKTVELTFGGKKLVQIRAESRFEKLNPARISVMEVSDEGVFVEHCSMCQRF